MHINSSHYTNLQNYINHNQDSDLYIVFFLRTINTFVLSLIGIFLPIYLYKTGFLIQDILLFYISFALINFVFIYFVLATSKYIGVKKYLFLRILIFISALYFMLNLGVNTYYFYLLPFLFGLEQGIYWMCMHFLFTKSVKTKDINKNLGLMFAIPKLFALLAPFIGGYITTFYGFDYLFKIAILLLAFSTIPLLFTKDVFPKSELCIEKLPYTFFDNTKLFLRTFTIYTNYTIEWIIWPLIVFLTLNNTITLGYVGTLVTCGTIIISVFLANYINKDNLSICFKIGLVLVTINTFIRFIWDTEIIIYISSLLAGLFSMLIILPTNILYFKTLKKNNMYNKILVREFAVLLGKLFVLITAYIFYSSLNFSFLGGILNYLILLLI